MQKGNTLTKGISQTLWLKASAIVSDIIRFYKFNGNIDIRQEDFETLWLEDALLNIRVGADVSYLIVKNLLEDDYISIPDIWEILDHWTVYN